MAEEKLGIFHLTEHNCSIINEYFLTNDWMDKTKELILNIIDELNHIQLKYPEFILARVTDNNWGDKVRLEYVFTDNTYDIRIHSKYIIYQYA